MARLPLSGDVIAPAISHCCGGPLPLLLGEVAFSSSSGATSFAPAATGSAIGGWRPPGMRPTQFRICSEPGCPEVVEGGGRCPEHLRLARSRNDARRRTSVERGYDHRWYRIAERYRTRHPVCEAPGCERPSLHVHHLDGRGPLGDNSDANLQALCAPCHNRLTASQPRPERRGSRPGLPPPRQGRAQPPPLRQLLARLTYEMHGKGGGLGERLRVDSSEKGAVQLRWPTWVGVVVDLRHPERLSAAPSE
jgi:5-methylcytosine-specific restriction enzyme A